MGPPAEATTIGAAATADTGDLISVEAPARARIVPGSREPGALTRFRAATRSGVSSSDPVTMDASTIADRRREGGGSPRARQSLKE